MRKPMILCLLSCWVMVLCAASLHAESYNVSFVAHDFSLLKVNGDSMGIFSVRNRLYPSYKEHHPDLPVVYCQILLPQDKGIESYTVTKDSVIFADSVQLAVSRNPLTTNGVPRNSPQGYESKFYDARLEYKGSTSLGQYRYATFAVSPFSYDAVDGKLYINTFKINIKLQVKQSQGQELISSMDMNYRGFLQETTLNGGQMDSLYPIVRRINKLSNSSNKKFNRYYIITKESFKETFNPFIRHKEIRGCKVKLITMEEIAEKMEIGMNQLNAINIRNYLKSIYLVDTDTNSEYNKYFLLLGGGVNVVPTAYCYAPVNNSISTDCVPCDVYYGCMGDCTWDDNNNGILGEDGEITDLTQSILVGRCPARNNEELKTFINKSINYDLKYHGDGWGDSIIFCGARLNGVGMVDVDEYAYEIYKKYLTNWNGHVDFLLDDSCSIQNLVTLSETSDHRLNENYIAQLQNNYSVVHWDGHGDKTCWMIRNTLDDMQSGINPLPKSVIDTADANMLVSKYPKLILTASCLTNWFDHMDNNPCLSEAFLSNPYSGIFAYIGSAREGFYDEQKEGTPMLTLSLRYSSAFLSSLYGLGVVDTHVGYLDCLGRLGYAISNDPYDVRLYYSTIVLGDPEIQLYTKEANRFDASCDVHDNSMNLTTNNVNCNMYWIGSDNIKLYYENKNQLSRNMSDSVCVYLSKYNYQTDSMVIYNTFNIQNAIMSDSYMDNAGVIYEADNGTLYGYFPVIRIGYDVTDHLSHGSVCVLNLGASYRRIMAQKQILIKNKFYCPIGSSIKFEINKTPIPND